MILEFTKILKQESILIRDVNLLFGTNGLDFDLQDLSAVIKYNISFRTRAWGIDNILLHIESIDLFANINIFKEDLNNNEIDLLKSKGFEEYSEDLTLFDWRLSIKQDTNDIEVEDSVFKIGQIMISDLSVDIIQDKGEILISAVVS
jgi:hypothetical protein